MNRRVYRKARNHPLAVALTGLALALTIGPVWADSSRDSVDWPGTYMGTLPSASGTGYQTFLVLTEKGNRYTLAQSIQYKGKMEDFRSNGRFSWNQAGSILELLSEDRQRFQVGENSIEQLGEDNQPNGEDYQLTKLLSYPGGRNEELLIDPRKLKSSPATKKVSFDAVWNMDHPNQLGHRSLWAHFELDCTAKSYRMPTIKYFSRTYLQGKLIDSVKNNDNDIEIPSEDRVMRKELTDHCPS